MMGATPVGVVRKEGRREVSLQMNTQQAAHWVYETCILFGLRPRDAHIIAALFIDGLTAHPKRVARSPFAYIAPRKA
ncbi:hypothetical protein LCGC14_1641380 [marine sediment metagenome]|uniref:Uncharacterized protein n=1 Tax=marine sediment metagenome TaxID=412755 RepID=A0A0F9ILZ5_9ZZZZ